MTYAEAATALSTIISIVLLFFLWRGWSRYRLDSVRQVLFAIRHDLFDIARDNPYLFQHPAYLQLRETINNSIRFAHKFTLTRLLIALLIHRYYGLPSDNWPTLSESLPNDIRTKLENVRKTVYFRLGCYLIYLPLVVAWTLLSLAKRFSLEWAAAKAKAEMKVTVEIIEVQSVEEARAEQRVREDRFATAGAR